MFLESEVDNSNDKEFELKFDDHRGYDQAVNVKATRPSAAYIESELIKNGCVFFRYDVSDLNSINHKYDWYVTEDKDLNSNNHKYDWDVTEDKSMVKYGMRRFWLVRKI